MLYLEQIVTASAMMDEVPAHRVRICLVGQNLRIGMSAAEARELARQLNKAAKDAERKSPSPA